MVRIGCTLRFGMLLVLIQVDAQSYTPAYGTFETNSYVGWAADSRVGSPATFPSEFVNGPDTYAITNETDTRWQAFVPDACTGVTPDRTGAAGDKFVAVWSIPTARPNRIWFGDPLPCLSSTTRYRLQWWTRGLTSNPAHSVRPMVRMLQGTGPSNLVWAPSIPPAGTEEGGTCREGWKYHYLDIPGWDITPMWLEIVHTGPEQAIFALDDIWWGPAWAAPDVPAAFRPAPLFTPPPGNMLTGGAFETATLQGFTTDYTQATSFATLAAGQWARSSFTNSQTGALPSRCASDYWSAHDDHTSANGQGSYLVFKGATTITTVLRSGPHAVIPGMPYRYSFYMAKLTSDTVGADSAIPTFALEFNTDGSNTFATYTVETTFGTPPELFLGSCRPGWVLMYVDFLAPSSSAASLNVHVRIRSLSTTTGFNSWAMDDVWFGPVPLHGYNMLANPSFDDGGVPFFVSSFPFVPTTFTPLANGQVTIASSGKNQWWAGVASATRCPTLRPLTVDGNFLTFRNPASGVLPAWRSPSRLRMRYNLVHRFSFRIAVLDTVASPTFSLIRDLSSTRAGAIISIVTQGFPVQPAVCGEWRYYQLDFIPTTTWSMFTLQADTPNAVWALDDIFIGVIQTWSTDVEPAARPYPVGTFEMAQPWHVGSQQTSDPDLSSQGTFTMLDESRTNTGSSWLSSTPWECTDFSDRTGSSGSKMVGFHTPTCCSYLWSSVYNMNVKPGRYRFSFWSRGLLQPEGHVSAWIGVRIPVVSSSTAAVSNLHYAATLNQVRVRPCTEPWQYHFIDFDIFEAGGVFSDGWRAFIIESLLPGALFAIDDVWFGPAWAAPDVPATLPSPAAPYVEVSNNLLTNAAFEQNAPAGFTTDFALVSNTVALAFNQYHITRASNNQWQQSGDCAPIADHTYGGLDTGRFLAFFGGSTTLAVWKAGPFTVSTGTPYRFSAFIRQLTNTVAAGTAQPADLVFQISADQVSWISFPLSVKPADGTCAFGWRYSYADFIPPAATVHVRLMNLNEGATLNAWAMDDVYFGHVTWGVNALANGNFALGHGSVDLSVTTMVPTFPVQGQGAITSIGHQWARYNHIQTCPALTPRPGTSDINFLGVTLSSTNKVLYTSARCHMLRPVWYRFGVWIAPLQFGPNIRLLPRLVLSRTGCPYATGTIAPTVHNLWPANETTMTFTSGDHCGWKYFYADILISGVFYVSVSIRNDAAVTVDAPTWQSFAIDDMYFADHLLRDDNVGAATFADALAAAGAVSFTVAGAKYDIYHFSRIDLTPAGSNTVIQGGLGTYQTLSLDPVGRYATVTAFFAGGSTPACLAASRASQRTVITLRCGHPAGYVNGSLLETSTCAWQATLNVPFLCTYERSFPGPVSQSAAAWIQGWPAAIPCE